MHFHILLSGNKCCDGRLASTMRDAMRQMATSPSFGRGKEGIIVSELQQKVQERFKKSYEVIVSQSDFAVSSWASGQSFCKFESKGFYILAYSTPKQYDIDEKEDEKKLAATSNQDPMGSEMTKFENQAPWHVELKLETFGDRAGYPIGSHCSTARTGSKCCSLILFNAMQTGYNNHVASSNFDPYDIRNISKAVQWNVEEVLQHSAEVVVSLDDFTFASYNNNSYTCKYRVDKYHILAYTTPNHDLDYYDEMATEKIDMEPEAQLVYPVPQYEAPLWTTPAPNPTQINQPYYQYAQKQMYIAPTVYQGYPVQQFNYFGGRRKRQIRASPYPIHQNVYNDIGSAKPFNCPADLTGLAGMACCDGGLQYEANKVIDQAKQEIDFDKHDTRKLAKLMTRAVQKRFGTTFESIVAQADFSWGTNKFNARTCKIDSDGYTALTYQSSSKPPPPSDFIDIPNDPTLGGPSGSSGSGGGGASNSGLGGGGNGGSGGDGNGAAAGNGADGNGGAGGAGNGAGGAGNGAGGAGNGAGGAGNGAGGTGIGAADLSGASLLGAGGAGDGLMGALAAAGGGACFSVDTWVTTPTGKMRMDEIDIGDYVLTADLEKTYFTPITLWIHREPAKIEEFLTIRTEFGKMLRLTPRHFLFRNKCEKSYEHYIKILPTDAEAVFASDLRLGDCVVVLYKGKYRQQRIDEITKTTKTGIYSPLTSNGRIIVNDMLASCYSEVQQNTLQTTFFWAYDRLRSRVVRLFGDLYNNKIALPTGTSLMQEILQLLIPTQK
uniref:HintN domain-containing protein n=2 Tax=Caenorhabditis japonica TaxID=281687 RepID=A0A8R1HZB1_CAEJA